MASGPDPTVTGLLRARSSETLVPGDLSAELEAWRRAATWATSDPPAPTALEGRDGPAGITPVHARLAELLIAHRAQTARLTTLERRLVRAEWAVLVCVALACTTSAIAAIVGLSSIL